MVIVCLCFFSAAHCNPFGEKVLKSLSYVTVFFLIISQSFLIRFISVVTHVKLIKIRLTSTFGCFPPKQHIRFFTVAFLTYVADAGLSTVHRSSPV